MGPTDPSAHSSSRDSPEASFANFAHGSGENSYHHSPAATVTAAHSRTIESPLSLPHGHNSSTDLPDSAFSSVDLIKYSVDIEN